MPMLKKGDMLCPHCNKVFLPVSNVYETCNIYDENRDKRDCNIYVVACSKCKKVVGVTSW